MQIDRGTKSLHEHNRSLLYSKRPKFKEDIRENIHVDKIRNDGVLFEKVDKDVLEKIIIQIKIKAKKDFFVQLKLTGISIIITAILFIYLKDCLDQRF